MKYITLQDLLTDSYERFIDESTKDDTDALDRAERRAVEEAKNYLSSRYDVELIFDETSPIRNEILVGIIGAMTLRYIFGRNAARKLAGTDTKENYEAAIRKLEKINSGAIRLDLPKPTDESGQIISDSIWGNSTNKDNYI